MPIHSLSADKAQQDYKETLTYLFARLPMFQRVGPVAFKKDLTNTRALLEQLGNPHHDFASIHIAGTNGKGSVAHLLAASFLANGMNPGIYTSPHYTDFRERIKVGKELIPSAWVTSFVRRHKELIETISPSFFELTVAMAFSYFAKQKVDIAIVETGLGGRLDSTNVISPVLSIITQIGWDHMDLLGDSLELIAREKAGIIKPGIPVVVGERSPETDQVFVQMAQTQGASLTFASDHYQLEEVSDDWSMLKARFRKEDGSSLAVQTDLTGPFQVRNLATFLESRRILGALGLLPADFTAEEVKRVRDLTGFMGRWQVLSKNPVVLCDSAHNLDGLALLFEEVARRSFPGVHIVVGFVQDKDLDRVLPLFPLDARYYFAKADVPRGMDAGTLKVLFGQKGRNGHAYSSVVQAFKEALRHAEPSDLLLVCGSIFVVGEVLPLYLHPLH